MSRFTIELTDDADESLGHIQRLLGVSSKTEVIRKAINLLNFVVRERQDGGKLFIENKEKNIRKEIVNI